MALTAADYRDKAEAALAKAVSQGTNQSGTAQASGASALAAAGAAYVALYEATKDEPV